MYHLFEYIVQGDVMVPLPGSFNFSLMNFSISVKAFLEGFATFLKALVGVVAKGSLGEFMVEGEPAGEAGLWGDDGEATSRIWLDICTL